MQKLYKTLIIIMAIIFPMITFIATMASTSTQLFVETNSSDFGSGGFLSGGGASGRW